jgi:predicted aspartyl protease
MFRSAGFGVATLVLASALGVGAARADGAPKCNLQQIASIPVIFRHNKPLVEVTINGQKALMLADTGSTRSVLFTKPAQALGLNPVGAYGEFRGVGGVRGAKAVTVAKLGFGGSTVNNLRLFTLDGGLGGDVVGVFGDDLLGQTDVEFDIAGGAIRLFDEKDCGRTNLAYWAKEPMVADLDPSGAEFHLDLQLNGRTVHATMDSGANTSVVTTEAASRVGAQPRSQPSGKVGGVGARAVEVTTVVFDTLKIGDEEIKKAKLLVGDYFRDDREAPIDSHIKRSSMDETEILLGADFLRSHRVFVSIRQKRMYFTYAGGPVFQVVAPVDGPVSAEPAK